MSDSQQSVNAQGRHFVDANFRGAHFIRSDLSDVVMRAVEVSGADIDAPWLLEDGNLFLVNGVNVIPYVEAELNHRFPGRARRRATDPGGLRTAWAMVEAAWDATLRRAAALPDGAVDISVNGEWSFAQTLRHLVTATDIWLRQAILGVEQPFHPIGQPHAEYETDGYDMSVFSMTEPTYAEVLETRSGRIAMVRDYLAGVTPADLETPRANPWSAEHPKTTLSCLHTILEEEWAHHRYAVRDLETLEVL